MTLKRKTIPLDIKLQVWTEAGGRCQFKGCNKPLWYNGLTLTNGNFSELAHIIGASEKGPRGNKESISLQDKAENIMLLCKDCHKEIDEENNIKKYPEKILRKWKMEHEERIKIQTSIHDEVLKTTILRFQYNIGSNKVIIADEQIYNAITPKIPSDRKGIIIIKDDFDRNSDYEYWMIIAEEIKRNISRKLELGVDNTSINHLSVFALGPMPLLMYLGKCLSETLPIDLYQPHRNIEDINKVWCWNNCETDNIVYNVELIKKGEDIKKVALLFELSDNITHEKYSTIIDESYTIYKFFISNPSPFFLTNKKNLEIFNYEYRKLLNNIQKIHGLDCSINFLPAVPSSIAIQIGRGLLPNKDPNIFVYEFYQNEGFKKVLKLN